MDKSAEATVYIVDDDESFGKSVQRLVESFGYKTRMYDTATSFVKQGDFQCSGCLLLDVRLPDIDGLELQQILEGKGCLLPIVFMTGHGDIPMSVKAIKNGASDFLPKPFQADDLRCAITNALERNYIAVQERREKNALNSSIMTLTPREKEVLSWVITGKLNKQIAGELGISEKTIKVHRSRVMHKTGVASVAELVRLAEKAGIQPAHDGDGV